MQKPPERSRRKIIQRTLTNFTSMPAALLKYSENKLKISITAEIEHINYGN